VLVARLAIWSLLGLTTALVLDYALYRMTLPVSPFIYQAF